MPSLQHKAYAAGIVSPMATSGLATIMFTDLVGSTRMRDRLGDDVSDEIGVEHDRIIGDALSSTGGRLVKNLGDGALAVFDSSVDAVMAGQRIQEGVALYNRQAEEARQIGVRIGINAGEVAHEDGDVIGLPVAVASRVCDKADGGQILITDTVKALIGRRARFPYVSVGNHILKGVDAPVELWSIEEAKQPQARAEHGKVLFPAFLTRGIPKNLVGRNAQLAKLTDAHQAAIDSTSLVAVIGEPGIGKTSLTSTWCKLAADQGATVVAGRCTPDAALPYEPFIEIARGVLEANPQLLTAVGPAAGNVAQLVPGIQSPQGLPVPIQTDPDTTLYLMAEAFAILLAPANGGPATVAVLDDLHWADEQTVGVLSRLARKDDLCVMLVGTYRDTDLVRTHPLPTLLSDLRRERRLDRISLQRLTVDHVDEMISRHFRTTIADDIIESIADETQGNPFFIEEITTHLLDEGAISDTGEWVSDIPIDEYAIPEGIRDVVGRRLENLGEDAVLALEVAAVMGLTFSIDIAGAIANLSDRDIDRIIDAAVNARIIEGGENADEFAFTHALLRQTLYEDLPTRRRTRLHRAVAEALQDRATPAPVLLNHWLKAERPANALTSAIAAANEAEQAFAGTNIATYLELALDLWDDVDDPDEYAGGSRLDIALRLAASFADFNSRYDDALDLIEAELTIAEGNTDALAALLNVRGLAYSRQGHATLAGADMREALHLSEGSDDVVLRLKILRSAAGTFMMENRSEESIEMAREALALAATADEDLSRFAPHTMLATSLAATGEIDEALGYFAEGLAIAEAEGDLAGQLVTYVNKGEMLYFNGRITEALQFTEDAIDRISAVGVPHWMDVMHGNAAFMLFDLGRWDEADVHLGIPKVDKAEHGQLHLAVVALRLAAERGDRDGVESSLRQVARHSIADVYPEFQGKYWDSLVSDLRWQGDLHAAFAAAKDGLTVLESASVWEHATRLTALGVEVVADGVQTGVADDTWLSAAEGWLERFSTNHPTMSFAAELKATATADLARAHGHNDAGLWRNALAAWGDYPYFRAKAQWRLARALIATDPADDEAIELLSAADAVAESLKAQPLLDAIETTRKKASQ